MQKRHHSRNRTRCNQITLISIWKANTNLFMFTPWWSFFPVSHHLLLTSRRVARQTIFLELDPALPGSLLSGSLLFSQRPSLDSWFWNHSRNNCAFCPWCYRAEWIDAHTEMRCHIVRTNEGHGRKLLFFLWQSFSRLCGIGLQWNLFFITGQIIWYEQLPVKTGISCHLTSLCSIYFCLLWVHLLTLSLIPQQKTAIQWHAGSQGHLTCYFRAASIPAVGMGQEEDEDHDTYI